MTPPTLTIESALFLDFDGTLVDLADTPDEVRLQPELLPLLAALRSLLGGAVAVITGRRLQSIDPWLGSLSLTGSGLHGAQLRAPGAVSPDDPQLPCIAELHRHLEAHLGDDARLLIENKGAALALHYRLAAERAAECQTVLSALAHQYGLDVIVGHAVVEARQRGVNKGSGLNRLMTLPPFSGRRPVFIGDDRTDEDAILAAQALGGDGIRVGTQPSLARYRLADVAAVHRWLHASRGDLERAAA